MKVIQEIEVPQETVDYVQRLHYDVQAYREVIQTMIELHAMDDDDSALDTPIFKGYQHQMAVASAAYQMAKEKIEEDYMPKELRDSKHGWNLNFQTGKFEVMG